MPPPLLFDISNVDLSGVVLTQDEIYDILPQRHEFTVLDRICHLDRQNARIVGIAEIRSDAWWCRGHLPGAPLLPGVVMLEMGGQLMGVLAERVLGSGKSFIAFLGVDDCKFRGAVRPPAQLVLLGSGLECRRQRVSSMLQGIVDGKTVIEARLTGMVLPSENSTA